MTTFKALIKKGNQRADKTWNVVIRFTHNGVVRFIPTTEFVSKKNLTSSFKIKNQSILDKCDDIIRIKQSLRKYVVPQLNVAKKRALTIEKIKSIFNLPYDGLKSKGI
jgi:hypothetical protein